MNFVLADEEIRRSVAAMVTFSWSDSSEDNLDTNVLSSFVGFQENPRRRAAQGGKGRQLWIVHEGCSGDLWSLFQPAAQHQPWTKTNEMM